MALDKAHFDTVRKFLEKKDREPEACRAPLTGFEQELELGRLATDPAAWAASRADILEKLARPGRVALTGGIASGKSTVAEIFEALGAAHIDFDRLARRAVEPGGPGFEAVVELLGKEVIGPDGSLDRPKIADLVFSSPELKARLENIIHPLTWEYMGRDLETFTDYPRVIISVPLLFEAGLETFFQTVILVFTGVETQIERLLKRQPSLDRAGAELLINNQWPAPPKVMGSTYVINNCGTPEDTHRQTEAVWRSIVG